MCCSSSRRVSNATPLQGAYLDEFFFSFHDSTSLHELVSKIFGTDSSVTCDWDQSMEDLMDGGRQYYEDVALPKLVRDPLQFSRCWR